MTCTWDSSGACLHVECTYFCAGMQKGPVKDCELTHVTLADARWTLLICAPDEWNIVQTV